MLRCAVLSSPRPLGGSRRVRRLERHVWCIRRCLATVRRLKRGSPSKAEERTVHDHTACASSLRLRACSQPSAAWILQACLEAGHSAKKARTENPTPSRDAEQPSIYQMWSPPVSPIWFGPYRLYNSPSGKGSARRSLRRTAGADRYARRDDSRSSDHACHARCAAPDRPVVQPHPSV